METLSKHWPEYLMEAADLAIFLVVASVVACLFKYPDSPVYQAIPSENLRRFLQGIAMGLTAIAIIHSPWGKQSGAHLNPAITLTFYRLGKVRRQDAIFYILFQCMGALLGIYLAILLLGAVFTSPPINYIVTVPGMRGWMLALAGEFTIAFTTMSMVLVTTNHKTLSRYTGLFAGCLLALYISLESPLSGVGMNPARSFASAFAAQNWMAFPLYLFAPVLGMFSAAELYQFLFGRQAVKCAKLNHHTHRRCIFLDCYYQRGQRSDLVDLSDRLL